MFLGFEFELFGLTDMMIVTLIELVEEFESDAFHMINYIQLTNQNSSVFYYVSVSLSRPLIPYLLRDLFSLKNFKRKYKIKKFHHIMAYYTVQIHTHTYTIQDDLTVVRFVFGEHMRAGRR